MANTLAKPLVRLDYEVQRTNESSFKSLSRVGWSVQRLPLTLDPVEKSRAILIGLLINLVSLLLNNFL